MRTMKIRWIAVIGLVAAACMNADGQNGWTGLASMNQSRCAFATVQHGDAIYAFFGNRDGSGKTSTVVERFDGHQWTVVAAAPPLPVSEAKAVSSDGFIYIVGGNQAGSGATVAAMWRFNPGTNQWQQCAAMPAPRASAGVVAMNGKIYVIGGRSRRTSTLAWNYHNTIYVYDPTYDYPGSPVNPWVPLASHPGRSGNRPLGVNTAIGVAGKIFVLGGFTAETTVPDAAEEIYRFDPDIGLKPPASAWVHCGRLPSPLAFCAATRIYGFVVVTGGSSAFLNNTYPTSDRITVFAITGGKLVRIWAGSLPTPLTGHGAGVLNGYFHVFGGARSWNGSAMGECWRFLRP